MNYLKNDKSKNINSIEYLKLEAIRYSEIHHEHREQTIVHCSKIIRCTFDRRNTYSR